MKQNYNKNSNDRKAVNGSRAERAANAQKWLDTLNARYSKEVQHAMDNTEVFVAENLIFTDTEKEYDSTAVKLFKNDVATCAKAAVTHAHDERICLLNFASPVNPGGGFLKGSLAQEEAICHATGLYPCLTQDKCKKYYDTKKFDDLLPWSYIYTMDCPLIVNGKVYLVDILTMAAVNRASNFKDHDSVMDLCQESAFRIPASYCADIVLLGAWGCGVFGNDPSTVAKKWKDLTDKYNGLYKEVVHPIIDNDTYKVFKSIV